MGSGEVCKVKLARFRRLSGVGDRGVASSRSRLALLLEGHPHLANDNGGGARNGPWLLFRRFTDSCFAAPQFRITSPGYNGVRSQHSVPF